MLHMSFRQLCSFTHPDLAEVPDDVPQQYRGLKALKDALRIHLQRHFCDVCLEGRKVCCWSSSALADLCRYSYSITSVVIHDVDCDHFSIGPHAC